MASHIRFKLKREYYEMCGFVQAGMALAVVLFNNLLLRGDRNKEERIRHHPELSDG